MRRIPERGLSRDEVFDALAAFKAEDTDWRTGRTWAYVYDPGPETEEVIKAAYMMFLSENALDPTVFPSMMHIETDLAAMAAAHLNGDGDVVGNFTSGGTESIMLAVKAAREHAREHHPEITAPEMVLPVTAHAAFHKAGHYLGVKPVVTDVDPVTFKADPAATAAAITPDTILMVGSAVSYAHGVVDPITDLGRLALDRDLWLHVDGCMGGFLLNYFRRLGRDVPPYDFGVPGVRSMSMDFHKYAFAAKGASVVLYRSKEYRRHQMYACASWTGYTVINPTVQSTKTGGPLAAAWAVLNFVGEDGYLDLARRMAESTDRVVAGIREIPALRILGTPEMNLVAFTSDEVGVFHVIDEMKERGWYVQPQLAYDGSKENVHLSVNPASEKWVEDFLADLADAVESARALTAASTADAGMLHALADLDVSAFDDEAYGNMLGMAGIDGVRLPERMAGINEILNALPAPLKERLLVEFLNDLYA